MPDELQPLIQKLTAKIVAAYVQRNPVPADQLSPLISMTHAALGSLIIPAMQQHALTPAVTIRRSVRHNAVICLECGWGGQMLRRHIGVQHRLTPEQYRRRWQLASDHPLTAPSYSERRTMLAQQMGLGRTTRRARSGSRRVRG